MNSKLLKVLLISLSLGVIHTAQAAALNDTPKIVSSTIVTGKPSPIEKALMQQKRGDFKSINTNDQLKILAAINNAPTQNFLAEQHQRFSRLLQSLFQPHSS
ncbi:hypothetical protein EC844_10354 [Acinetobacter calcoaceticus]|uniref:DUF4179 domain-containing protein n=1 Tax=Acinetobacter calcoaceticus TaxID=471 RepID=A0A4R1XZ43_ACICA|nr:hypothetical protein EC844_10354 [Acinetobacter calcoaceticus]